LQEEHGRNLLATRQKQPFASMEDFKLRTRLSKEELRTLAEIGALNCFAAHRREALWQAEKRIRVEDLFAPGSSSAVASAADSSPLISMNEMERLQADYAGTGLTVGPHAMALLRAQLPKVWRAADLPNGRHGQFVRIAGNVICRQRPGTAKGFVFISLEDETGIANAIVAPPLFEKLRLTITQEPFLLIAGRLQTSEGVIVVQARHIEALVYHQLAGSSSHDFH